MVCYNLGEMVREREGRLALIKDAPPGNFQFGITTIDLPSAFGDKTTGKTADIWTVEDKLVIVKTDRNSAHDILICSVPGSGASVNALSNWWKTRTKNIIENDYLGSPDPAVTIARKAKVRFDVEFVFRSYLERSSTRTSAYHKYRIERRRNIYGIDFPDDLMDNQELPMGTIFTPTTKSDKDEEITEEQAREIVNQQAGKDVFDILKERLIRLNQTGKEVSRSRGIILASTKFEAGLDGEGNLMVIDEVLTPHSSRFWDAGTYERRFLRGEDPDSYDKEILRRKLKDLGFTGQGAVPKLSLADIRIVSRVYKKAYEMITKRDLSHPAMEKEIVQSIVGYFNPA